eukprot:4287229-Pyramimonas_sp.AAC.2
MGEYFTNFHFDFLLISAMFFFFLLFKFWYHGKYIHVKLNVDTEPGRAAAVSFLNRGSADY